MTHCSDIDTLVSLSELLGERTLEELRHVLQCDACREHLDTLTTLRVGLGPELEAEPGFADAVLRALPSRGERRDWGAVIEKWVGLVASPVLAAMTALLVLVQTAGAGEMPLGVHVLVLAGLAGAAVALWNRFGAEGGRTAVVP